MSNKPTPGESAAGALLALVIAIVGAFALMHFAACEQYDSFCAFTGYDGGPTAQPSVVAEAEPGQSQAPLAKGVSKGRNESARAEQQRPEHFPSPQQ